VQTVTILFLQQLHQQVAVVVVDTLLEITSKDYQAVQVAVLLTTLLMAVVLLHLVKVLQAAVAHFPHSTTVAVAVALVR
jgi:hypothetical protein